ncbi:MAG: 6-phosphogluconate dehydrogenase, NAD-binding protein [Caulobacteraceae bacterium]|nr:6-phosphogluconate dehydrogenase, NAD-binding protein [Caulobacteraceae bacterium]
MKVGWIGLGQMGRLMAMRVLQAGHELAGHSREFSRHADVAAAGGVLTGSVVETAQTAEVLCVNLFDDGQLTDVLIDGGALAAMRPGSVLAVHTTGAAAVIQDLAQRAPEGVAVLDATFSGHAGMLKAGDHVTLMVGGEAAALERVRPVLAAYCDPILLIGEVGAARRLKLINNMLYAAHLSLACEAVEAAEQMGLDHRAAVTAIRLSSGASAAFDRFTGDASVAEVKATAQHWLDKDTDTARAAARELGIAIPLLDRAARWGSNSEVRG